MARPVGRPSLPYETRHVMLNIRTEYYVKLKNQGVIMSKLVNDFLHALHEYTICPLCYSEDVRIVKCAKCDGRGLVCDKPSCKRYHRIYNRECECTEEEYRGEKA